MVHPPTGQEKIDDTRKRVLAEISANARLSQTGAAQEAGVNASALSQWMKGKYPGDNARITESMERWLGFRRKRATSAIPFLKTDTWCPTPTAQKISAALSYAQMAHDVTVIFGGAGVGKTETCKKYASSNPNVWHVTMTPSTAVVGACLERVALKLGLHISGRAAKIEMAIMERLTGTDGLLIIDEAQHLNVRSLEALRSLHDATGVGLAILGNDLVYAQMTGRGARSATFAQLFSRIGKRVKLLKPKKEDVNTLCKSWKITDADMIAFCQQTAEKPGALRIMVKTIRLGQMVAGSRGERLALKHLKAAWRDLES
ncbi:MAG: AAA family ATPase [Desulfobacterales bacterium]|nr:AAA family ATPase [Desulfobacterales bacterium]